MAAMLKPKKQLGLPKDMLVLGDGADSRRYVKRVFWAEEDWLWLGVLLGTLIDWRVSRPRGAEIRARVQGVLDDMRHVGVYKHCRTPWIHVFDATIDVFPTCVVTVPEQPPRGAVIFLHGHGGNTLFQAFLLREFARQYGLMMICPTLSYGPWEEDLTMSVLKQTWQSLSYHFDIQPSRTFLAGLSQGAAGVAVAGAADQFAGLIFLSPTMILKDLSAPGFVAAWQGREVLVIHGEQDRHVTKKSVDAGIATMARHGIAVQATFHPQADHSLFLLDTEEVLSEVGAYCERHLPKEPDDGTHPVT
jgi:predicted esterase